jgi:translation initiation factor IF-3
LKKKRIPINEQIFAKEVRLVSEDGEHFGVVQIKEALLKAKERDLDLVQITDNVNPPVCKITDFGKYSYEENKKKKKQEKANKSQVKSIRLGFAISTHDMEIRVKAAEKFLNDGDSVRIILPLRGRQKALQDVAKEKMEQFLKMIEEKVELKVEKEVTKEPKGLTITVIKK